MLGTMIDEDLRVFDGVAVSVSRYSQVLHDVEASDLADEYWRLPCRDTPEYRYEELSVEIGRRLAKADLSELAASALHMLGESVRSGTGLIVRSSATGEDSDRMSYAGQFESHKCSVDSQSLELAIKSVWSSCTRPHVVAYQDTLGAQANAGPGRAPRMGLAIQPLRDFSLAGLLFTQHPIVPIHGWMLLEYLDVDPAKLVSGETVPHRCRIAPDRGTVLWETRIPDRPVLTADECDQLVTGASRLRSLLGCDVDIEWGIAEDVPYFLQCRPATTLPADG